MRFVTYHASVSVRSSLTAAGQGLMAVHHVKSQDCRQPTAMIFSCLGAVPPPVPLYMWSVRKMEREMRKGEKAFLPDSIAGMAGYC